MALPVDSIDSCSLDRPTLDELNLHRPPSQLLTPVGPTRQCSSLSTLERCYLGISLLSLIVTLGLTIERISDLPPSSEDFTFALILLCSNLFCFWYVISGIMAERPYEMGVFCASIFIVWGYVLMNYLYHVKIEDSRDIAMKLVRFVFSTFMVVVLLPWGLWIAYDYRQSNNLIFRVIGANEQNQGRCRTLFMTLSLMKFDAQLQVIMLLLLFNKGFGAIEQLDVILLVCGAMATALWLGLAFLAIRTEQKTFVYLALVCGCLDISYAIYKFNTNSAAERVTLMFQVTWLCGIIAILVRLWNMERLYRVMTNFGYGISAKVFSANKTVTVEAPHMHHSALFRGQSDVY